MAVENSPAVAPEIDEGSWVYLSAAQSADPSVQGLRECLVEACEASGWATVSRSSEERVGRGADPGNFFESMRHAVEHADVVVSLIDERSEMSGVELALAYSHGRPVIGVQVSGGRLPEAGVESMLKGYARGRVIVCRDAEECATGLREAFTDPDFVETIRQAR